MRMRCGYLSISQVNGVSLKRLMMPCAPALGSIPTMKNGPRFMYQAIGNHTRSLPAKTDHFCTAKILNLACLGPVNDDSLLSMDFFIKATCGLMARTWVTPRVTSFHMLTTSRRSQHLIPSTFSLSELRAVLSETKRLSATSLGSFSIGIASTLISTPVEFGAVCVLSDRDRFGLTPCEFSVVMPTKHEPTSA